MQEANGYLSFDGPNKETSLSQYTSVAAFSGVNQQPSQSLEALASTVTRKAGFYNSDYYEARPQDSLPIRFKDIVLACRIAYLRVGIIRNVTDMMIDFICDNIKFVHQDKKFQKLLNAWKDKVKMSDAICEFAKHMLIDNNVVVKRKTAKLTKPVQNQWEESSAADTKIYKQTAVTPREIPIEYNFLNILSLYWVGDEADKVAGKRYLAFKPSDKLISALKTRSDPFYNAIVNSYTYHTIDNITGGQGLVKLDTDKVYITHGKKDSWEDWAPPYLYCILSDIAFKNKLRQAEMAALDGWVNVIRLWKLGDHKEKILPTETAINKLTEILKNNTGGGAMDLVWDSMIDMKDYYPPVDKILGQEKYVQVDKDILVGLGIPEVLIGGSGSNFSNSWIQLKTVVERLKYIRGKIDEWLKGELRVFCEAMGQPIMPKVKYSHMNLDDENVAKKLIISLFDRGLISGEAVVSMYNEDFDLEIERMKQENVEFKKNDLKMYRQLEANNNKQQPAKNPGRPLKGIDTSKRSERTPKVQRASGEEIEAAISTFAKEIDDKVTDMYVANFGLKNARQLTLEQREKIADARLIALSCIKYENVESKDAFELVSEDAVDYNFVSFAKNNIKSFAKAIGKKPSTEQVRKLETEAWLKYNGENNG